MTRSKKASRRKPFKCILSISDKRIRSDYWTVNAKQVTDIDRVIESRAKGIVLSLAPNGKGETLLVQLHDALLPHREGSCDVSVQYIGESATARLTLGPEWTVKPCRELREKLSELLGSKNVRMLYAPGREIR